MGWSRDAVLRPIVTTGQSAALTSGADVGMTNAITLGNVVQLSCAGGNCMVTISKAGIAATASGDTLIKATDPPLRVGCAPGDKIHAWGLGTGVTLYAIEMTY